MKTLLLFQFISKLKRKLDHKNNMVDNTALISTLDCLSIFDEKSCIKNYLSEKYSLVAKKNLRETRRLSCIFFSFSVLHISEPTNAKTIQDILLFHFYMYI